MASVPVWFNKYSKRKILGNEMGELKCRGCRYIGHTSKFKNDRGNTEESLNDIKNLKINSH